MPCEAPVTMAVFCLLTTSASLAVGLCRLLATRVLRQTMRKRLQAKLNAVKAELQRRMHEPVPEMGKWLQAVVRGHIRYYGVPLNQPALFLFRFQVGRLWHRALLRRSQN